MELSFVRITETFEQDGYFFFPNEVYAVVKGGYPGYSAFIPIEKREDGKKLGHGCDGLLVKPVGWNVLNDLFPKKVVEIIPNEGILGHLLTLIRTRGFRSLDEGARLLLQNHGQANLTIGAAYTSADGEKIRIGDRIIEGLNSVILVHHSKNLVYIQRHSREAEHPVFYMTKQRFIRLFRYCGMVPFSAVGERRFKSLREELTAKKKKKKIPQLVPEGHDKILKTIEEAYAADERIRLDNCKNAIARWAYVLCTGGISPTYTGVCHANVRHQQQAKGAEPVAIINFIQRNEFSEEELVRIVNWMINDSPYAFTFISKNAEESVKNGYVVTRTDLPYTHVLASLTLLRWIWEFKEEARLWLRLVEHGVPQDIAFLASSRMYGREDSFLIRPTHSHHHVLPHILLEKHVSKFLKHNHNNERGPLYWKAYGENAPSRVWGMFGQGATKDFMTDWLLEKTKEAHGKMPLTPFGATSAAKSISFDAAVSALFDFQEKFQ